MKNLLNKMDGLLLKGQMAWKELKNSERGDTNFISMIVIIAIILVLAGLFLTLGEDVMDTIKTKVTDWLNSVTGKAKTGK